MQRLLARIVEQADAMAAPEGDAFSVSALKAQADLISLAARTAEKILEMNKVIAVEEDASGNGPLSEEERTALSERVEKWIDERAEARMAEWIVERTAEHDGSLPAHDAEQCDEASLSGLQGNAN